MRLLEKLYIMWCTWKLQSWVHCECHEYHKMLFGRKPFLMKSVICMYFILYFHRATCVQKGFDANKHQACIYTLTCFKVSLVPCLCTLREHCTGLNQVIGVNVKKKLYFDIFVVTKEKLKSKVLTASTSYLTGYNFG